MAPALASEVDKDDPDVVDAPELLERPCPFAPGTPRLVTSTTAHGAAKNESTEARRVFGDADYAGQCTDDEDEDVA